MQLCCYMAIFPSSWTILTLYLLLMKDLNKLMPKISMFIGSYRGTIVGGTPEFLGQLIALLLVDQLQGGNPIMLLPSTLFPCSIYLCNILLAGFLARDCYEGVLTCDLWVSVLIGSYISAIVGATPEILGKLIALLL